MLHNQVLPAIPRQKVRNIETGEIAEVLGMCSDQSHQINVVTRTNGAFWNAGWEISNCEPVPEEPRRIRIGDPIAIINPNATNDIERHNFSRIEAIQGNNVIFAGGYAPIMYVRHANPEELAKYF